MHRLVSEFICRMGLSSVSTFRTSSFKRAEKSGSSPRLEWFLRLSLRTSRGGIEVDALFHSSSLARLALPDVVDITAMVAVNLALFANGAQ